MSPVYDSASFPTDAIWANDGCTGGPAFEETTSLCHSADGSEQRNSASRHARRIFSINTGAINDATHEAVRLFYDARRGKSDSFRFKDPFDYTASGEPIVGGQLVKRYTVGSVNYDRPITKPISGTVTFSGGGTLNYETGVISGGAGGTWSGQFEIEARFDADRYTERNFYTDWHEVSSLIIKESFDSDIPAVANTAPAPIITYTLALPLEIGRERYNDYSTYMATGGGYSEERITQYTTGGFIGFAGNVLMRDRTDLETLISLFLCVRGGRSGFQREVFDMRFGQNYLNLSFTGTDSFECPVSLVEISG